MDVYPGAETAIALCEHLGSWDMFRTTAEVEGIESLKERMRCSIHGAIEKCGSDAARVAVLEEALRQWDHPNFHLYLRAKLGAL